MRLTLVRLGGGWWWKDSLTQFIVDKNRCSRRIVFMSPSFKLAAGFPTQIFTVWISFELMKSAITACN